MISCVMKIAVLGGGFNPPHIGHLLICQQVLSFTGNDEVWFLPYFQHPWDKQSIDPVHRLNMCKLMSSGKIKTSDLEINSKKKNYTFETVDLLISKYKQHDFSWIIGSDLWPEFMTWEKSSEMLKRIKLLVFPRAGFPVTHLEENVVTINNKLLNTSDISSEKIREMVHEGLPIDGLVTRGVGRYITENKLYKSNF